MDIDMGEWMIMRPGKIISSVDSFLNAERYFMWRNHPYPDNVAQVRILSVTLTEWQTLTLEEKAVWAS